jgi:FimV-like protein
MGHKPDVTIVKGSNVEPEPITDDEQCFPWRTLALRDTTVSATRLKVPPQATREYRGACEAYGNTKFPEAEQHARGAIGKFQNYSAAWVLLGMILEQQRKPQEARDACARAASIDANYLPAYLCGAEISSRNQDWNDVIGATDRGLGVQSQGNAYLYYYRAKAYLHLNKLSDAKTSALRAIEVDVNHSDPSLYFVLAQVYEREGDTSNAITQLQELLKHNPDAIQQDMAKQLLAKLESRQSAK